MKKMMMADLIKQVQEEVPVPGDLEDTGQESVIDLSPIGVATYKHNPEHDVYIVTVTLDKGGEDREYVLSPEGLIDLIELGTKYFYNEMESSTFDMTKRQQIICSNYPYDVSDSTDEYILGGEA